MTTRERYAYRAARRDGAVEQGLLEAPSREGAAAALAGRGLYPIELRVETLTRTRRATLPMAELALGLRLLADLLEAGLPMSRALAAFTGLAPEAWRPALPGIRESVKEGRSLAAALDESSIEIPAQVIGMLRAGEAGSALPAAVRRAAEMTEEHAAMRAAIRGALAYPAVLAIAGAASVLLLAGVVLPRFALILSDLGATLPPTTRFVIAAGEATRRLALPGAVAIVGSILAWRSWTSTGQGREQWHRFLLALPLIGAVRRKAASARTAASLSALLESGVPLASAMTHAARSGGDAALEARFLESREAVTGGERLSRAVARFGAMTDTLAHLIRAGEETGRLAALLGHGARIERLDAERAVRMAVRLIEPVMILAFGGMVALVAAALLQAVYSVRPV